MKRNVYALLLGALLCLFSCKEKQKNLPLIRSELLIDDDLCSLSLDSFNSLWIGSEDGKIYKLSNFSLKEYDLSEDVIYKVNFKIWKTDTLLWVASRNNGLQIWKFNAGNKPVKLKTYTIKHKQNKYSPYDFLFDKEDIYVATSFGLYKAPVSLSDSDMELLVPPPDEKEKSRFPLYITHNLHLYKDSIILGATSNGLFSYNKKSKKTEYPIKDMNIDFVSVFQDTIYASNEKHLLYKNFKDIDWKRMTQATNYKLYFKNKAGFSYGFSPNDLTILNTSNLPTTKINDKFPFYLQSRNLIVDDTLNQYTYFISSQSLWKIPFQNTMKHENQEKDIIASCTDTDSNYFFVTSQNDLYKREDNNPVARWIYSLDKNQTIQGINCIDNLLYYYNSENEIYQVNIPHSWYSQFISTPLLVFKSPSKITTTYAETIEDSDEPKYYIGTQYGLYYLNSNTNEIIQDSLLKNIYVTSFFKQKNKEGIFFSTLNDGIFYKKKIT